MSDTNSVNEQIKMDIQLKVPSMFLTEDCVLSDNEKHQFMEELLHFLDNECIIHIKEPNYREKFTKDCLEYAEMVFINDNIDNDTIEDIVEYVVDYYCDFIMISRSFLIDRPHLKQSKEYVKKQIAFLENVEQPPQRTEEWYHFRHNLITASSAWKILDTQSNINNYIYSKCTPLNTDKYKTVNLNSPCHWGNKYEPVSTEYYEKYYNTKIQDFGCIPHNEHKNIGASPDGINVDPNSEKYGRMLEIKNIVNRDITGIPKKEYWVQMQLQMEVCNLDYCDFLECRFKEYENEEQFNNDGSFTHTEDGKEKGIIYHFYENDEHIYEYAPLSCSKEEFETWSTTTLEKHNDTWVNTIYWRLEEVSCVLVPRNRAWFQKILPFFLDIWDTIIYERENGYDHRKAKKRKEKAVVVEKHEDVYLFQDILEEPEEKTNVIIINTE